MLKGVKKRSMYLRKSELGEMKSSFNRIELKDICIILRIKNLPDTGPCNSL